MAKYVPHSLEKAIDNDIRYCPNTGHLYWSRRDRNRKMGFPIGCYDKDGYKTMNIMRKTMFTHHVVWFIHHREWPSNQIDHINGVLDDNRIGNLRLVTQCQNQRNRNTHRAGRRLFTTYSKVCKKWAAQVPEDGKQTHVGYYDTELEANQAARLYLHLCGLQRIA